MGKYVSRLCTLNSGIDRDNMMTAFRAEGFIVKPSKIPSQFQVLSNPIPPANRFESMESRVTDDFNQAFWRLLLSNSGNITTQGFFASFYPALTSPPEILSLPTVHYEYSFAIKSNPSRLAAEINKNPFYQALIAVARPARVSIETPEYFYDLPRPELFRVAETLMFLAGNLAAESPLKDDWYPDLFEMPLSIVSN